MRPLNLIANRCFAYLFSYLVNTRLTDTLCGTKVLLRKDYEMLARERAYFGNFDPFGDFDLIFGAAKQNLKIIETPIHYKARTFGETQISRFRDGWLLLNSHIANSRPFDREFAITRGATGLDQRAVRLAPRTADHLVGVITPLPAASTARHWRTPCR